jgi:hypothetical protein
MDSATEKVRLYKPAPPHNSLMAPAVCMCIACCRIVLDLRCPAENEDGIRCGDYAGHRKADGHTMIPATIFLMAEERLRDVKP